MCRSLFYCAGLAVGALAGLAASASAADLDQYLPDDSQSVTVVNVKQITSWTPFQKQIQPQIEMALKMGLLPDILKDAGVDPFKDIDRVIAVAAADSYKMVKAPSPPKVNPVPPTPPGQKPPPGAGPAAPGAPPAAPPLPPPPPPGGSFSVTSTSPFGFTSFVLIQGKFDVDKLEAAAQKALKDHPEAVKKPRMVGGIELWEVGLGSDPNHAYLALLDKGTLMATALESQALEAIDKASGKRKTDLKDKQVRDAVAKADPKAALQAAASGDLIAQVAMKSNDKGGFTTTTRTLRDDGVEGYRGSVGLGDADFHYQLSITTKDAAKAADMAKQANDGLQMGITQMTAMAQQIKEFQPIVDAMKKVKIGASAETVSIEGSATPDAIEGAFKAFFIIQPPAPPPGSGKPPVGSPAPPDKPTQPDAPPPPKKDK